MNCTSIVSINHRDDTIACIPITIVIAIRNHRGVGPACSSCIIHIHNFPVTTPLASRRITPNYMDCSVYIYCYHRIIAIPCIPITIVIAIRNHRGVGPPGSSCIIHIHNFPISTPFTSTIIRPNYMNCSIPIYGNRGVKTLAGIPITIVVTIRNYCRIRPN